MSAESMIDKPKKRRSKMYAVRQIPVVALKPAPCNPPKRVEV